jgi:hypothetical protein
LIRAAMLRNLNPIIDIISLLINKHKIPADRVICV